MLAKYPPIPLADDDYDHDGRPKGRISLSWRTYSLALGDQACWLAEYEDLPGYYGEGATIQEALDRLWQCFGRRPHYRVALKRQTPDQLKKAIKRKHDAMNVAALTRADGWDKGRLGAGDGRERTARLLGVGTTAVSAARAELSAAIDSADGQSVVGVNADALAETARTAGDRMKMDLWVADEAPWRLRHTAARKLFPI